MVSSDKYYLTNNIHRRPLLAFPDKHKNRFFKQKIKEADNICNHEFNFLGLKYRNIGNDINWHKDFATNHIWPVNFYRNYKTEDLMPENNIDIKRPWELARMHHMITLAQAWKLSKNVRYSDEFFRQWKSWNQDNPFCFGIHWSNTMEVAIRATNLIFAMELLYQSPGWDKNWRSILESIRQHGQYIEHNLELGVENSRISKGNHYLANICGLTVIGMVCCSLPDSKRWVKIGMRALEMEMREMVLEDGFFFEASTGYHRLSLEFFLYPFVISKFFEHNFSNDFSKKLEKMLDVIMKIITPDGTVPKIGDSDDGRLLIISNYQNWDRNDFRYLLGLGSIIFNREDYRSMCDVCPEEIFWIFGTDGYEKFNSLSTKKTIANYSSLDKAGLYVIRNNMQKDYIIFNSGILSENAPSAHRHNDSLGIELWLQGKPILVDPGTYCYTSNMDDRNYFRSTKSHNTIMVDDQEINFMNTKPFAMSDDINCETKLLKNNESQIILESKRYNKVLDEKSVLCKRKLTLDIDRSLLFIEDALIASNNHKGKWYWHFHPEIDFNIDHKKDSLIIVDFKFAKMQIERPASNSFEYKVIDGWYSESYGDKQPSKILRIDCNWEKQISMKVKFE